ncbi:hypothetical protein DPX16_18405 [Anabarilius grahami]|uniref:Uncharacterized protein n=1 Tax=Anabarilius grahami TaxID=495550 RepID=A0A3N0YF14_ANAGA|nr:hypothetical protein DPX16_18405 [Anabarilius grahami]
MPNSQSDNSQKIGLAVGLPIFFVALLLAGIAVLFWFRHRKSVDIELSNKLKSQDKSHDGHSRESPYSGYSGGLQPAPQSPIYENFQSGQSNLHEFQRSAVESEETHRDHQAYLQCDGDAIYSNDPTLFHPDQAEISEDIYIMPDA